MDDAAFEWDERKAAANVIRHGAAFAAARRAFQEPFAVEWRDERHAYGEDRFVLLAMVEGRLLYVAYTVRGDSIRIISARGADSHERRRYHESSA